MGVGYSSGTCEVFEKFLKEDMIFVNGGTFLMGATAEQGEACTY